VNTAQQGQCGSCGEPVYWLKHQRTGKPAPIEIKTDPKGNIAADLMFGVYFMPSNRASFPDGLHLNHFVHCPQRAVWKKAGRR
jgi:hypothetical protein